MKDELNQKQLSVSECVDLIRTTLSVTVGELAVKGEMSGLQKRSGNTLVFFSLKDDQSYVDCFMLAHEVKAPIENGMEVVVFGYPSLFKKSGKFHLRVRSVVPQGEGALQKQLLETKQRLEKEGLFNEARKRKIPRFPERIVIITSEDAAAYTDVKRVLEHRWPIAELTLVPAAVQGAPAIPKLIRALRMADDQIRPDTIILTRGGGNLEDLQAFNSEDLARAIFSCKTPVVVGVGHERDWTIADLVADVRAATPSNAAELSAPDVEDVLIQINAYEDSVVIRMRQQIDSYAHRIFRSTTLFAQTMRQHMSRYQDIIIRIEQSARTLLQVVNQSYERVDAITERMPLALRHVIRQLRDRVLMNEKLMTQLSPSRLLQKGYSITRSKGRIIRSRNEVKRRDILTTTMKDGDIESEVT